MAFNPDVLLSRSELCERWRCSISTIKRLEDCGDLIPIKIGRLVRHRLAAILAYENRDTSPADRPELSEASHEASQ